MRLFVAVVPPAPVLDHLDRALESVRGGADPDDARGPLRWTPSDQRHLTLAFYGDVPDGALDDIANELSRVAAATGPFELSLRGAGVFDNRTLWVGCGGDTDRLGALTAEAVKVGRDVVGRGDERVRSRAHVTVARVPGREHGRQARQRRGSGDAAVVPRDVALLAHALAVYQGPPWPVREIALIASRLGAGPGGHPLHTTLALLPLRAVAG